MKAGQLEIDFATNIAKIATEVQSASRTMSSSVKGVQEAFESAKKAAETLAVGFGLERFAEFVLHAVEAAAALEKLSERTGMTTESLSQMQYAAKLAEVPTDSLTIAMKKLAVSISQAEAGDQTKIALFKQMGISQADLGKGTQAVMLQMADAYAHAQDGAGKAAVSIALMGKAGDEMIPFLNQGASGIHALMEEADRLGLTIGPEFAEAAAEWHDNMERIHAMSGTLAIVLGKDLVESTGRAMQAFIDAAKEGHRFLGALQAIQTFLTGDDLHKANVTITEDTDKLLRAQNDLDRLKRQGYSDDSMAVQHQKAKIAGLQDEINTSLTYKHSLEGQADAAKAAAEAAKKQREEGDKWKAASKEAIAQAKAEAAEFHNIRKSVDEVIAATKLELSTGMALTDYQKLEVKTLQAVKNAKVPLTEEHKRAVEATLAEAKAILDRKAARDADLKNAKTFATEWGKANQEYADFEAARDRHAYDVALASHDEAQALKDETALLALEFSLIGATDAQRSVALANKRVEIQLAKDKLAVDRDETLDAKARARRKKALEDNAAASTWLNNFKAETEQMGKFWGDTFKGMEDALINFVKTGKLDFTSLVDSMVTDLIRLAVQQYVTAPLWQAISGSSLSTLGGFLSGARAGGGPVDAGRSYLVGERGPEIFTPSSSGQIIPNGGGAGSGPTIVINATVGDVASRSEVVAGLQAVRRQIAGDLVRSKQYGGIAA